MSKVLLVDHEKCTGCRLCELVCSVKHTGSSNPARSRIRVAKWETEGIVVPVVCHQCEEAPCIAVCPTSSRARGDELHRTEIDYDRCIGCRTCVAVCPFGASFFDPVSRKVITCDLCDGDPQCVKFCATGALSYVEASDINKKNQREAARRLYALTDRGVTAAKT